MREEIIELLGKEKRALSATEICDKLNLNTAGELKKLLDDLRILEEGYTVYRSNKDKYMLFENSHLLKGRLSVNKKGFGFVIVDGRDEDIYIDAKNMNGALNNDLVVVEELKGQNGKKTEGRVVKVLKKENNLIITRILFFIFWETFCYFIHKIIKSNCVFTTYWNIMLKS